MILFFGIAVLLAVIGLRKADGGKRDYMSVNMTNSIKGFFLIMVFFRHILGYREFAHPFLDRPFFFVEKWGQCIVIMFLFYSGYGVMESIKKKGQAYVKGIPLQRALKVLLLFDSAIVLFWIYRLFTGVTFDAKTMLLAFVGWKSIGNSNWYIFSIIWLYIFTFIAFRVFKNSHKKAAFGVLLLSLLYMMLLRKVGRPYYCYDTTLCYVWGMLFSLYRKKIEDFVNEGRKSWLFFLVVSATGYLLTYFFKKNSLVVYQIWVFCFAAAIVIFTMRFVVDSRPLQWLGRNLFPLYILQRLPMMFFNDENYGCKNLCTNDWLYVVMCFAATLVITVIYQKTIAKAIGKLISFLSKKGKNVESRGGEYAPPEDKKVNFISHISGDKDSLEHLANGNQFIGKRPVLKNSTIHFNGRNNILFCEDNVKLVNSSLTFQGDNAVIYLSSNHHEYKLNTVVNHNSVFYVGKNTYFNGVLNAVLSECRHVLIGAGGLFSFDIWIRNADPHLVYNCETMKRMNPTQSVYIGEHVWIGQSAMLLKGTQVGAGSIIGAMSLVAGKKIPSNTSWGGNPAKLLKEHIFWEGSCVHAWTREMTEKSLNCTNNKFIFTGKERSISYDEIDERLTSAENVKARLDYLLEVKEQI